MKPTEQTTSNDDYALPVKEYSCFLCNAKSNEQGLPLTLAETTYSRICLGEKLQEILGDKLVVLAKPRDSLCWDCAHQLNWVDKYEMKLTTIKENIIAQVRKKYKDIEMCLQKSEGKDDNSYQVSFPGPKPESQRKLPQPVPAAQPHIIEETVPTPGGRRKRYSCSVCSKTFSSLGAVGAHVSKYHPSGFICEICKSVFPTEKKCKSHMLTHTIENQKKLLSCVSCGFKAQNTEVYCRHVCNSKILSLTCSTCKKRYVDSNISKGDSFQCPQCRTGDSGNSPSDRQFQPEMEITVVDNYLHDYNDSSKKKMSDLDVSMVQCSACGEKFEVNSITAHSCLGTGDIIEFSEVEPKDYVNLPMYMREDRAYLRANGAEAVITHSSAPNPRKRRIPKIPAQENFYYNLNEETRMHCKTCHAEFKTINLMRQHWEITGHSREVSTTTIELNRIKDKNKKLEKTFKVVKQNFNIRAVIQGQNDEEIRKSDETHANCIVRVQDETSLEDFIRQRDGKECETCGILFGSEEVLREHQRTNCLTCVTCNITFLDNKLLKKHYLYTGHANRIIIKKDSVDKKVPTEEVIDGKFICKICGAAYHTKVALNNHMLIHDDNKIEENVFKCSKCERRFYTKAAKNRHEIKHTTCNVCGIGFSNQRLLLIHTDLMHRQTSCRSCRKLFANSRALKLHEKNHLKKKNQIKCKLCPKRFKTKSMLESHSKIHTGEAKFECKTCGIGFISQRLLEDHQIVHIQKEYTCPKCTVVCPSKANFLLHMKQHDTAYMCDVCGKLFKSTSLLAVHRRRFHVNAKCYQCPKCQRSYSAPSTLKRHLKKHLNKKKCKICNKSFKNKTNYLKHVANHKSGNKLQNLNANSSDADIFHAADIMIADNTLLLQDSPIKNDQVVPGELIVESVEIYDTIPN